MDNYMQNTEIRPITYTKSKAPKCKHQWQNPTVRLHQTKMFLCRKWKKISKMKKATYRIGEKKKHNSIEKNKTLIRKWAEELNRLFSKRGHTYGQQVHGKMLKLTNHQEMQTEATRRYYLTHKI